MSYAWETPLGLGAEPEPGKSTSSIYGPYTTGLRAAVRAISFANEIELEGQAEVVRLPSSPLSKRYVVKKKAA